MAYHSNMRPSIQTSGKELYECIDCSGRAYDTAGRRCEECGGQLQNISNERDL